MRKNNNILLKLDWQTILIYFILVMLGWMNIYAAVFNQEHQNIFDISQKYGKQLLWIGASVLIIIPLLIVKPRAYSFLSPLIYGIVILLLITVLLIGKEINGAKSWIEIGSLRLQPAEFAKPATALLLARIMSVYNFKISKLKNLFVIGIVLLTPMLLILLQNDTGSALVYFAFILVFYREGLSGWVLLIGALTITLFVLTLLFSTETVCGIILLISFLYYLLEEKSIKKMTIGLSLPIGLYIITTFLGSIIEISIFIKIIVPILISSLVYLLYAFKKNLKFIYTIIIFVIISTFFVFSVNYVFKDVLSPHQQDRINNLLGIEFDPLGAGYNVNQSLIAIGSGGFSGKGFLQGTQTKYNFVPEQSTDFIFCTVGEEWGFVGSIIVLLLFLGLLLRLIHLSERQKSGFTRIYGYSVASIFFFHVTINIGMTIGLAPVIGIPLPFFSYGGSSLWSFSILLFIFLRLDANRNDITL